MSATDPRAELGRRSILVALGASLFTLRPAFAQLSIVADAALLGRPWRLPSSTRVELLTAQEGLDLPRALDAVQDWQVPVSSQLIIRLADGRHTMAGALAWRHASGERVAVVGNPNDPARCQLTWTGITDGIYVGAGAILGGLDGVTLVKSSLPGVGVGTGSGLLADEGGTVICGNHVHIDGFYYGVQARRNGAARCDGLTVRGGGDANFFAYMGGHIEAPGALSVGAHDPVLKLGSGFVAEYGGSIDATGAVARLNALDGFTTLSNGVIRAHASRAERNGRSGYYADTGGRIVAHDGAAVANCGDGVLSRDGPRAITGDRLRVEGNNVPALACRTRSGSPP